MAEGGQALLTGVRDNAVGGLSTSTDALCMAVGERAPSMDACGIAVVGQAPSTDAPLPVAEGGRALYPSIDRHLSVNNKLPFSLEMLDGHKVYYINNRHDHPGVSPLLLDCNRLYNITLNTYIAIKSANDSNITMIFMKIVYL